MIFDRRPIYLIGGAIALAIVIAVYFLTPRVTPEMRVQEQLAVVASEPWVRVRVEDVQYVGSVQNPSQVMVHARRAADGSPIAVQFVADSPYTSPSALRRLTESSLEGCDADIKMVPTPIVQEKFRGAFQPDATHAGVAIYAFVLPPVGSVAPGDSPSAPATQPAATTTDKPAATMPVQPAITPPATAAASTTGG